MASRPGDRPGRGAASRQAIVALQAALGAEQAATYGYGIVGSHLSGRKFAAASADWVAHQRARDSLVQMISVRGATPRPAAVAYRLPVKVSTAAGAVALAIILERQVAAVYLGLVALNDHSLRAFGAAQMASSAVRQTHWSGHSQAFPGLPGRQ